MEFERLINFLLKEFFLCIYYRISKFLNKILTVSTILNSIKIILILDLILIWHFIKKMISDSKIDKFDAEKNNPK